MYSFFCVKEGLYIKLQNTTEIVAQSLTRSDITKATVVSLEIGYIKNQAMAMSQRQFLPMALHASATCSELTSKMSGMD